MTRRTAVTAMIIAALIVAPTVCSTVYASDEDFASPAARQQPLCGLYCIYGALRLLGHPVDAEKIISPTRLSVLEGTNALELCAIAREEGLDCAAHIKLDARDLMKCDLPVILHVKSSPESKTADHWVLVIARQSRSGTLEVLDPLSGTSANKQLSELISAWSGFAIVLGPIGSDVQLAKVRRLRTASMLGVIAVIALIASVANYAHRRYFGHTAHTASFAKQLIMLVAIVLLAGTVQAAYYPGFVFARSTDIASALQGTRPEFPRITRVQLNRQLNDSLIIDARRREDFLIGHLPNALSVPVYSTDDQIAAAMGQVPHDKPIVLYCQSAGCDFADRLARRLRLRGYDNLSVYAGGWLDWAEHDHNDK